LYTQNIDGLDYHTSIARDKIVSVHGSIAEVECEFCKTPYPRDKFIEQLKNQIRNIYDPSDPTAPSASTNILCPNCLKAGLKPSTVMYGCQLPPEFFRRVVEDFPSEVDCLIVAGTSLAVWPACELVTKVSADTPRLLVNREPAGRELGLALEEGGGGGRDGFLRGDCDEGFLALSKELGWVEELAALRHLMCDSSANLLSP
jgi:NAD-dependent SIR2 family protein deacetylase